MENLRIALSVKALFQKLYVALLAAITLCCVMPAFGQTGRFFCGGGSQLSTAMVNHIMQDKRGFIWISTSNGLNIYNGYDFRILKADGSDGSLLSNQVNCINQMPNGRIYVGTSRGLQYIKDGKFVNAAYTTGEPVSKYITQLFLAKDGTLYGGVSDSHGVFRIGKDGKVSRVFASVRGIASVKGFAEDNSGRLWMVTEANEIYAAKGGKVQRYLMAGGGSTALSYILVAKNGDIYVSTLSNGIYRLTPREKVFRSVGCTAHIGVNTLMECADGSILMGTDGMGVVKYNPSSDAIEISKAYNKDIDLHRAKIKSMILDREGNFWCAMYQKGVYMHRKEAAPFRYQGQCNGPYNTIGDAAVAAVCITRDSHIWVSTDGGGIYELDHSGALLKHFDNKLVPPAVLSMTEDEAGRLWVASYVRGAGWIDRSTGTYHQLPCTMGRGHSVFDILLDGKGKLWIGTLGDGLKCFDMKTQEVREFRTVEGNGETLCNNYVKRLCLSSDGRHLYVGTASGLSCMDLLSERWIRTVGTDSMFVAEEIFDIAEDKLGNIWVCTENGVHILSKDNSVRFLSSKDNLADNNAASIQFDRSGRAWVSTLHGMSCITPGSWNIENYYAGDGLLGDEFSKRVSCSWNNMLCFGGIHGIVWFNPADIKRRKVKPDVFISAFSLGDKIISPGDKSGSYVITERMASQSDNFDLNYDDNSFTISLSTLTYDNPEGMVFLYRINDNKWERLPRGENSMELRNFQPGTYRFQIRAEDNGTLSDIKEFTVRVHPVWYFSTTAKVCYAIFVFALAIFYIRMLQRRHKNELRLQEHIHAEEMTEQKLKFFINLGHDIRTPMTLIVSPLEQLIKQENDAYKHNMLVTIRRNVDRILGLVNQMMDLRKIDKGMMVMRFRETDMVAMVKDVMGFFEQHAKVKDITVKFESDADTIPVWVDRKHFDTVLMNIVSNAFKYTKTGGNIAVCVEHDDKECRISVWDDGEKIPEAEMEKIFERFYQVASDSNGSKAGTGIGLDVARAIVEQHGGRITAHNNVDSEGCTFVIAIPMGCEHIKPEDIIQEEMTEEKITPPYKEISDSQEITEEQQPNATSSDKVPTIVIAEDDDEIRRFLTQELGDGYNIIGCANGKEALTLVKRKGPQLLITDVMMPEMDGTELCAAIKGDVNLRHIPIIMLTAKTRDEDMVTGLSTGVDAYLTKPFNLDVLRNTIINLLNTRKVLQTKFNTDISEKKIDDVKMLSADEQLMERVVKVINANLTNDSMSVEGLAAEVGLSRVHLYRKMKEQTGQSPQEFIRNIRLKKAAHLLAQKNCNITTVVYACGFGNATSFSTMFKKVYGVSPRQYMAEHQKE